MRNLAATYPSALMGTIPPLRESEAIGSSAPTHLSEILFQTPSTECIFYMTDISVVYVSGVTDNPISMLPQTDVEILTEGVNEGETLAFKGISLSRWECHQIVELTDEVAFKFRVPFDSMERVGFLKLLKLPVEKFKSTSGPCKAEWDILAEEVNYPAFKLKFTSVHIELDGNYSEEAVRYVLKKDPERFLSMVLDLPDNVVNKPNFLDACGVHLMESFANGHRKNDVDNAILAFRVALQSTKTNSTARLLPLIGTEVSFMHREGNWNDMDLNTDEAQIHIQSVESHLRGQFASRLYNIGRCLVQRFQSIGDFQDITGSISFLRQAILFTSDENPDLPLHLSALGTALTVQFQNTGRFTDISEAISLKKKAIQHTRKGDSDMPSHLCTLAQALLWLFSHTGELKDVDDAILLLQQAVQLTPEDHLNYPDYLSEVGNALQHRFSRTGELTDISDAIAFQRKAVNLAPEGHTYLPNYLSHLGSSLQRRFSQTTELTDISDAISFQRKAVQLTPEGHTYLPNYLSCLGTSLHRRFVRTGELTDISDAISFQQKAVDLTPEGHTYLPVYLAGLGISLQRRYLHTGELTDISDAISLQLKAVQLTPEGHTYLPIYPASLHRRFLRTGELTDISDAISAQQKAVHTYLPLYLSILGISLQYRFLRTGELTDICDAISFQQKAVQLTPSDHPGLADYLSGLATSLQRRFLRTGELTDISDAISFQQKVVQLTPEGHKDLHTRLSLIGESLQCRSSRTGNLTDISDAILYQQKAVQLTPDGHIYLPAYLAGLGISLQHRYLHTGELADICDAISFQQKAVQLTPEGHAYLPIYLSGLGTSLQHRFSCTGEFPDISDAISLQQTSVELTPEGHLRLPANLYSLARSLSSRFDHIHEKDFTDINTAMSCLSLAANSSYGFPTDLLDAAKYWIELSQKHDSSQSLKAYQAAIHIISRIAGLEQTIERRHDNLIHISALSAAAVSAAFLSQKFNLAVEWLEQGRCLVWSQLNDLRTPLDTLRSHDPQIAQEFMDVSRQLENAGSRVQMPVSAIVASVSTKSSLQDEEASHVKLAYRWDQLVTKIRTIPNFEGFLQPPSSSTMLKNLPNCGILVVINVHQDRCDALALKSSVEPLHIALPEISYEKLNSLHDSLKAYLRTSGLRMRESRPETERTRAILKSERKPKCDSLARILSILWTSIVKPILNQLGYLASEPPQDLLRIWWCATGPLAFLPIHAAGIYDESATEGASTLSDFAVSSYTPTVRALLDRVKTHQVVNKEKPRIFMISQPDTPGLPPIPGTTEEIRQIEQQMKSCDVEVTCLESAAATVARTIANMKAYSCVNLACHAKQETEKPLSSGFSLYDGRLELSEIIQLRLEGADLAFLSACQTSRGDEKLSEEAVHLAAGMLAAGYRGVVATMWSINDRYGPRVAADFYSNLVEGNDGLSGKNAARALHYAIQKLRKSIGDSDAALLAWVPYVHFGL